ncbi:hypothetical protein [Candidatus Enterococcus ferrettii]|uniref:EF-hand domain-containing protein n=1 Tax=Candidatus Enterococcus ferrettii TaxID=2815324 RepID=A0ABV0EWI9_9ENTE|nr:hypothetical protein [Enterococcus sp. 665A]MBO1339550.1 hypothetical protein [Enterococcus sp. 665A]
MKKIIGLTLLLCCSVALTGCGSGGNGTTSSSTAQSTSEVKSLKLTVAKEFTTDDTGKATIKGSTDPEAKIKIEDDTVTADNKGKFTYDYKLEEAEGKTITITASLDDLKKEQKVKITPSADFIKEKNTVATSTANNQQTTPSSEAQQSSQIGQVLTTPWGEQVTVLRVLPNGERVISEETSQADINNDGVLTYEELVKTENDMDAQNAQQEAQVGKVLITPWGEEVTVLRVLPNGERVISEQTSQADINNDGILTYEELVKTENDMDAQKAQ